MRYLIRCCSDKKYGLGHFMRCIRLYNELKKRKKFVKIYIDKKYDFMKNFIFDYSEIYPKTKFINQNHDSNKFIEKIFGEYKKNEKKIVIKDDYRLKFLWEKKIAKKLKSRMVVFDDFDNSNHFADLIINPKTKFIENDKSIVNSVEGKKTTFLLGPKYSLVEKIKKNPKFKKFTVIVNFGGSKKTNYIKNILHSISKSNENIDFIFILSPIFKLKLKVKRKKNVKFINDSFDLQNIYSKSHLFLGAAGTSVYEVSAQKIPGIFFKISDNQETSHESLEKMGQYFFLNKKYLQKKYSSEIFRLIQGIKNNYENIKFFTKNPLINIDDKGVSRIVKNILKIK